MKDKKRGAKLVGYKPPIAELKNKRSGLDAIYINGENDLYPYFVVNSIDGSPTASLAHRMHARYIAGVLNVEDYVINTRTGDTLSMLIRESAKDFSAHSGFFIHINYGYDTETEEFFPKNPTILQYEKCRLNKEDDAGYWSKVFFDDFFKIKGGFNSKDADWYYRYNPTKSAIIKQIQKDSKDEDLSTPEGVENALRNYRGQVAYVKATYERPYTRSMADSVLYDCVSEYFISQYFYQQTANGFSGKILLLVRKTETEEERDLYEDVQDWIGLDNSGGIYLLEVDDTEDVDKVLKQVTIQSIFNGDDYKYTEKSLRTKILGAFDNLPEVLVYAGEGALFGTNPELYENAQKFYDSNTQYLRELLQSKLTEILKIDFELKGITE